MDSAVENLIKYFMTIVAAAAVCWKGLDSWGKRKSAPIKDLESRIDEGEKCIKQIKDDQIEMKAKQKDTLEIVLSYFKK